jgi:transposase-like protein
VSCGDAIEAIVKTWDAQPKGGSLAKWVWQACIDRGDFGPPEQGQLTSDERAELAQLRKENRELRRENYFFRLATLHFAKEQLLLLRHRGFYGALRIHI